MARGPATLDPLLAASLNDELVTRQVYEPLVERLAGPYGDRRASGLALEVRPEAGRSTWRLRLREGVRFQDGARFNASAVLDNASRWQGTPQGRALLPGLAAVDAPRPDLVRFLFDRPSPSVPRALSSPRLGIVSPRALGAATPSRLERGGRSGTGPFELRERGRARILLARNVRWWGTRRSLGPALDQAEFRVVPSANARLRLLRRGDAQVAEGLGPPQLRSLRGDPLLTGIAGPGGTGLGLDRSVRGIDSAVRVPILSEAWLTTIGSGGG